MSRYAKWAQVEHSEATRIAALLPAGPVFLGLLRSSWPGLPTPRRPAGSAAPGPRWAEPVLGGLMAGLGFSWPSVDRRPTDPRPGTPLPVMPTQELLTEGPFRYCRNPMTLGTILAYLGMAVAARTTAGAALVVALAASLLVYLKRIEEGELAELIGEAYLAYRDATPFIIPRRPRPR